MDFRKIFDSIPEEFDKWRTRYCDELFADVIEYSRLDSTKTALEIGPGTGQATEPILKTGCSYLAIELGENLAEYTKNKFSLYDNFKILGIRHKITLQGLIEKTVHQYVNDESYRESINCLILPISAENSVTSSL